MANYFVRVELFGADAADYEKLHEGMSNSGFEKTITFTDGKVMDLPTACYVGVSNSSSSSIRDVVKVISKPLTTRDASIIVLRYDDWSAFLYPAD